MGDRIFGLQISHPWNIGRSRSEHLVLRGTIFWVLVIASSFLGGTFPILGGAFTVFQIMVVMGAAKFVIEDLVLKRRSKLVTTRIDLLLIASFMGVLTLHGIKDRFGMRFLGSDVWGGRNYVDVYVGLLAFFVAQSVPLKAKFWNEFPYLVLAVTAFDLAVAIVTTIYPSSIFKIYPFYSAVSVSTVEELMTGTSTVTGRIGALGKLRIHSHPDCLRFCLAPSNSPSVELLSPPHRRPRSTRALFIPASAPRS